MNNHIGIDELLRVWMKKAESAEPSLMEMEQQVRLWMHWLGRIVLWLWLQWWSRGMKSKWVKCPHCGQTALYNRQRSIRLQTMFGHLRVERAYYQCADCHQGHAPLDVQLGLRANAMSAELERLVARVGVQMPFGQASELFKDLTLVSLSDHSFSKAAQAYGQVVEQTEHELYQQTCDSQAMVERERQAVRPLRMYGSLDGGRVQLRAPKGQQQPWRELKIG